MNRWSEAGQTAERQQRAADIASLAADPRMAAALRAVCLGAVKLFEGSRLLNAIVSDRARVIMGFMALYLDAGHDPNDPLSGLTVNRYKTQCAATGLCSPGRAAAMLGLMRFAGYLQPAVRVRRGQPLRLVPTEKLLAATRQRWRIMFAALAHVRREGEIGLALLDNPDFPKLHARASTELFFRRERAIEHGPAMRLFADRKAGVVVLMSLMLSAAPGDTMPPRGPMSVSVAQLARRFAVSRAHVKDILQSAVAAGLLTRAGGDEFTYVVTPLLRESILGFFAALFVLIGDAIAQAERDIRAGGHRPLEGAA